MFLSIIYFLIYFIKAQQQKLYIQLLKVNFEQYACSSIMHYDVPSRAALVFQGSGVCLMPQFGKLKK